MPAAKPPKAPTTDRPVEEHRKHADEFLAREEHKKPKPTTNDEAKP